MTNSPLIHSLRLEMVLSRGSFLDGLDTIVVELRMPLRLGKEIPQNEDCQ